MFPKLNFLSNTLPQRKQNDFSKYIHVLELSRKFIAQTRTKKEHACVFLRKPGNLQPIQLIQHLHMNLDSESFKIPSYTDLIKN